MTIRFDGRSAIVTGAGAGLGRAHALALAARGAAVTVADLRGHEAVAAEIAAAGGRALPVACDVADDDQVAAMVAAATEAFGGVDILIANAGMLRDRSFAKMTMAEFRAVIAVHLTGAASCARAVWPGMRARGYGRIVFTTSSSGLYGNFGQANYAAAKAGLLGLMNTLHLEGAGRGIRVNMLSPTAATAMTEGLLPPQAAALLDPAAVTPGLLWLAGEGAPSRTILAAGAGCFALTTVAETQGVCLTGGDLTPEGVAAAAGRIADPAGARAMPDAFAQTRGFARRAAAALGRRLGWD